MSVPTHTGAAAACGSDDAVSASVPTRSRPMTSASAAHVIHSAVASVRAGRASSASAGGSSTSTRHAPPRRPAARRRTRRRRQQLREHAAATPATAQCARPSASSRLASSVGEREQAEAASSTPRPRVQPRREQQRRRERGGQQHQPGDRAEQPGERTAPRPCAPGSPTGDAGHRARDQVLEPSTGGARPTGRRSSTAAAPARARCPRSSVTLGSETSSRPRPGADQRAAAGPRPASGRGRVAGRPGPQRDRDGDHRQRRGRDQHRDRPARRAWPASRQPRSAPYDGDQPRRISTVPPVHVSVSSPASAPLSPSTSAARAR